MQTATNRLRQVLRRVRTSLAGHTDEQLLTQFVQERDEAAFAALVRRHGPMVLGVSRRILHHVHDAEDVLQATFLVLARKAHAVVRRETVGSWLYQVAYRTALEARAMRTRRRKKECLVQALPQPEIPPAEVQDWRPILDEELSRLPDKYQAVLVLCDLEARSRKEAAQELRIPEGTLSSRLAKARSLLATRLARRGVTLAGTALTAALADGGVSAQVTGPLVAETARLAVLVLVGQLATVSTPVALLMKGALQTMFIAKLKVLGALLLVAGLTLGLGSGAFHPVAAQNPAPAAKPASELEALRRENALLKLNLEVVLEKVRAQGAELQALKESTKAKQAPQAYWNPNQDGISYRGDNLYWYGIPTLAKKAALTPEDLLRKLREAKTDDARAQAVTELERAVRQLRDAYNNAPAAKQP